MSHDTPVVIINHCRPARVHTMCIVSAPTASQWVTFDPLRTVEQSITRSETSMNGPATRHDLSSVPRVVPTSKVSGPSTRWHREHRGKWPWKLRRTV